MLQYSYIIYIILFFKRHVLNTAVKATGISRSTAVRVVTKAQAIEFGEKGSFQVPQPASKPSPRSSVNNCGQEIIRRIIHNFHITEKRRPTVDAMYTIIKDEESLVFIGYLPIENPYSATPEDRTPYFQDGDAERCYQIPADDDIVFGKYS
ncbi:hypothetical protein FQA39_LY04904 [Lamprigera yunnana]|nr:hypothetical protein FQA39_LY04904 [Lamprigera yunnana]